MTLAELREDAKNKGIKNVTRKDEETLMAELKKEGVKELTAQQKIDKLDNEVHELENIIKNKKEERNKLYPLAQKESESNKLPLHELLKLSSAMDKNSELTKRNLQNQTVKRF